MLEAPGSLQEFAKKINRSPLIRKFSGICQWLALAGFGPEFDKPK